MPVPRLLLACLLLAVAPPLSAQERAAPPPTATDSSQKLRLFLDCASSGCDFDFLRTELTWVDYVRDRTDAQVHVISTSLGTGSGGQEVTFKFIGLRDLTGVDDELHYTTPQGASSDEQRREFTRVLKLGLVRYLLRTSAGKNLALTYQAARAAANTAPAHDPWNFWVFSIGANGFFSGESKSKSSDWSGNFNARRTTEQWKFNLGFSGSTSKSSYDFGNGTTYEANSHSWYGSGLVVRSLGAHLSAGATFGGYSSTQENVDLNLRVAPTLEYDFFKYAEYTRRRLVASYSLGLNRYRYTETTLYDKDQETRLSQSLSLSYAARAPWGNANVGVSGSNYLSDFHQNRMSVYGGMSIRLVKGLQFSYNGSYSRVRDQITLPKGDASDEEVLLRLRQQRTSYRANGYFSLSYTFGSVFNNVVNPRLGNSGGGGDFFFF
ncbi:MAG: hypothetical protein ABJC19_02235 [Gemmatimonadota bacterium]